MPEIEDVDEHPLKAVIPVDERQIEPLAGGEEPRKDDLRFLWVMFNQIGQSRFSDEAESQIGEPGRLVWVDDNMGRRPMIPGDQAFAYEEGRQPISQSDLDRPGGSLPQDPVPEVFALGATDCDWEKDVD